MRALSNEGSEHVIVRCGLLKKNDKFTQESFSHHWLHIHGPIAAGMKNLRVCNQNLVIDNEHRHPIMGGVIDIDGYSELHFDTYSEMLEGVQSLDAETGNALLDDAEVLLQKRLCDILVFSRNVVREVPPYLRGKNLVHRVSFLNRAEGVSVAEFRREWCYAHAKLVEAAPGHAGYNQNLVIDRFVDGASVSSEKLPCDGMAEFYFEDMDAFECFYDSKEFQRLTAHGSDFIGSVDTYLVETHPVVAGSARGGYCL